MRELGVMEDTLDEMRLMVKTFPALNSRVNEHSHSLQGLRQRFLGGSTSELDAAEDAQRARLLAGDEVLGQTSDRLVELQRIGAESEELGARALTGLHSQRGQLEAADSDLERLDVGLRRARATLSTMTR